MELLTIIYEEIEPDVWNGYVLQYRNIVGYKMQGKEVAIETMYLLVTEEMFYRTRSFNSWRVSKETYIYLGESSE